MEEITLEQFVAAINTHKTILTQLDKADKSLENPILSWELRQNDCNIKVDNEIVSNIRVNREDLKLFIEQLRQQEIAKFDVIETRYKAQP